jgi:hypothetical protein
MLILSYLGLYLDFCVKEMSLQGENMGKNYCIMIFLFPEISLESH